MSALSPALKSSRASEEAANCLGGHVCVMGLSNVNVEWRSSDSNSPECVRVELSGSDTKTYEMHRTQSHNGRSCCYRNQCKINMGVE